MSEINAATFEQIEDILSRLATNYSNMADLLFNIFYNQEPGDYQLQMFDKAGVLQTYTIPNRAKDRAHLLNGEGNPEGNVLGNVGDLYQDLQSGELYIKQTPNSTAGWLRILDKDDLEELIIQGSGSPEEVVSAKKGTLYIDSDSVTIYIKTTTTGTFGWVALGGGTAGGVANTSLSNLTAAGNARFDVKEDVANKVTSMSAQSSDIQYPSAKCVYDELTVKENTANKVSSISAASTDQEYPSAKCIYDLIGDLGTILSEI